MRRTRRRSASAASLRFSGIARKGSGGAHLAHDGGVEAAEVGVAVLEHAALHRSRPGSAPGVELHEAPRTPLVLGEDLQWPVFNKV